MLAQRPVYERFCKTRIPSRPPDTAERMKSAVFKKAFGRYSIRVVITAVFAVLLSVMASLTWFLTFRNGQASIRELTDQIGRQSMLDIRHHLEEFVAAPRLVNEINASPFEEGDRAALTREAMTHRFIAWLTRFPSIVSIAFADQEGNYLGVSRGVGGVPLSLGIASQSTKGFLEGYAIDPFRGTVGQVRQKPCAIRSSIASMVFRCPGLERSFLDTGVPLGRPAMPVWTRCCRSTAQMGSCGESSIRHSRSPA